MPAPASPHPADLLARAADRASAALSKWLGRPSRIAVRTVGELSLPEAMGIVGTADGALVACAMHLGGALPGLLVLACDDAGGLALADLLLDRPLGTSRAWDELERSVAIETANILGCAYLNAVAAGLESGGGPALLPSPPWFVRDYGAAIMEGILAPAAMRADRVFLTHTDFTIESTPASCALLFIPEPPAPPGARSAAAS